MAENNPLLEAYAAEKEKELDQNIVAIVVAIRKYYLSFVSAGFSPDEALKFSMVLWEHVSGNVIRSKNG